MNVLAQRDYDLSLKLNQLGQERWLREFLIPVSRLGDGPIWYVLILGLPVVFGRDMLPLSLCLAVTALSGVLVYKKIKAHYRRPRPYQQDSSFLAHAVALDEHSFPSGHTLHATAFLVIFLNMSPSLALVFAPFALATAASRVVLGVHYLSDVVAGAITGTLLAIFWLGTLGYTDVL